MTKRTDLKDALEASAYVDGAMDDQPARREAFEQRLADDPDLRERVAAYRRQKLEMQQAFQPLLDMPVPHRLYRPLEHGVRRPASGALRPLAAAAMVMLVGIGAGWTGASYMRGKATPAHVVLKELRQGHVVAGILSAGRRGAMPLASGIVAAVPTDQLQASGLTETERSMTTVAGRPALVIDYRTAQGQAVTLMVQRRPAHLADTRPILLREKGFSASVWTGDTTVYTLISPTSTGPDIAALTAHLRDGLSPDTIPMPAPLTPDRPLASGLPGDGLGPGVDAIPAIPGLGQMPGDTSATGPAPEGRNL
jgi:anti-sigma factor RsiW